MVKLKPWSNLHSEQDQLNVHILGAEKLPGRAELTSRYYPKGPCTYIVYTCPKLLFSEPLLRPEYAPYRFIMRLRSGSWVSKDLRGATSGLADPWGPQRHRAYRIWVKEDTGHGIT